MDKRKLYLYGFLGALGAGLVYAGYATWDDWRGLVQMMLGGM
jgi:hypothetical protein